MLGGEDVEVQVGTPGTRSVEEEAWKKKKWRVEEEIRDERR